MKKEKAVIITEKDLTRVITDVQIDLLGDDRLDRVQQWVIVQMVNMIGIKLSKGFFEGESES